MTSRSGASFSGRFESRSSSGTRPTRARRIRRRTFAAREIDRDDGSAPVRGLHDRDRKLGRFERRVDLGLPPLGVDDLAEVPLAVEESDADERYPEVARRLQQVAREDAEAAGIDRQDLRQSELGREVGDALSARDELAGRGVAAARPCPPRPGARPSRGARTGIPDRPPPARLSRRRPRGRGGSDCPALAARRRDRAARRAPNVGAPRPAQVVGQGEEGKQLFGYAGDPKCLFENGCQLGPECTRPGTSRCGAGLRAGHRRSPTRTESFSPSARKRVDPLHRRLRTRVGRALHRRRAPSAAQLVVGVLRLREVDLEGQRPRRASTTPSSALDARDVVGLPREPVGEALDRLLERRVRGRPRGARCPPARPPRGSTRSRAMSGRGTSSASRRLVERARSAAIAKPRGCRTPWPERKRMSGACSS